MSKRAKRNWVVLIGALVLAVGIAPWTEAQAGQAKTGGGLEKSQTAAKSDRGAANGPQEGIKVHGDWTITIRNQDGSIASRHEFKNALSPGNDVLARVLARWALLGRRGQGHTIVLGPGICGEVSLPVDCRLSDSLDTPTSSYFPTVTQIADLRWAGSATASHAGRITFVNFLLPVCSSIHPNSCPPTLFTVRDLTQPEAPSTTPPDPINVLAGQTIDVTVVISFS